MASSSAAPPSCTQPIFTAFEMPAPCSRPEANDLAVAFLDTGEAAMAATVTDENMTVHPLGKRSSVRVWMQSAFHRRTLHSCDTMTCQLASLGARAEQSACQAIKPPPAAAIVQRSNVPYVVSGLTSMASTNRAVRAMMCPFVRRDSPRRRNS